MRRKIECVKQYEYRPTGIVVEVLRLCGADEDPRAEFVHVYKTFHKKKGIVDALSTELRDLPDGWHRHNGECPCDPFATVKVWLKNDKIYRGMAGDFTWNDSILEWSYS